MAREVAAVKTEMQEQMDTLQIQLNHWQNVTTTILQIKSGRMHIQTHLEQTMNYSYMSDYAHSMYLLQLISQTIKLINWRDYRLP